MTKVFLTLRIIIFNVMMLFMWNQKGNGFFQIISAGLLPYSAPYKLSCFIDYCFQKIAMVYPISENENDLIVVSKNQFDIKKFLFKLFRYFPWILLSVLVAYFIGKIYLRYTPELHRITANLLIKDEEEASSDYKILKS